MQGQPLRILIADDDHMICDMLAEILTDLGNVPDAVHTATAAITRASSGDYDLVMLDMGFPDCQDLSTLEQIRESAPETDVMMVTSRVQDMEVVSAAVRLGCFDYIPKPIREEDIRIRVTRLKQMRAMARACKYAFSSLAAGSEIHDIVGRSPGIIRLINHIRMYAATDVPILILGETGTGKELVARALHFGSPRRESPFHCINCAALTPSLVQAELFGHEKGAFTGAVRQRKGAFELAEDGTLFLDEIGDMDLASQCNLLRVLESGVYQTVGGVNRKNHARILAATNHDLDASVKNGQFRKDLYYRIKRGMIEIPPLRKRKEDIPMLVDHFLGDLNREMGKGVTRVPDEVLSALTAYDWLGNVRELRNEIERAYIHAEGDSLRLLDLSPEVVAAPSLHEPAESDDFRTMDFRAATDIQRLVDALRQTSGNISRAATLLGVHRNTISRWIKRYGLEKRPGSNQSGSWQRY